MHKLASISMALIVAGGVMIAAPATAAPKISNGVACKKLNSTTSVSGSKYKCVTNPLSTSKKLTWLSLDCINSANVYLKASKSSNEISSKLKDQIPVIDLGIANEITNKAEVQAKLDAANLRLPAAKTKLSNAKADLEIKKFGEAVASWTAAIRAYTSKINLIDVTIKKLENARSIAVNQPEQLLADLEVTKTNAALICTKGF